ncbi:hypothetical protein RHSP_51766 [Rhizobium freirei PRF 81]|uniref:Uncharacterized protein n=1 Tax=Rhizobium freirei PRF 81 TaxID=363754 RepID=N6V5W9_9HYPH|nr:hypothetical protein RHSP_51766 [Rhizobium freirei PRF 81]
MAENMRADHLAVGSVDDQLHDHLLAPARKRRLHRPELSAIDLKLRITLGGVFLGQADRANLRLREDGRRDQFVIRPRRIVLVDGLDEAHGLVDRHRRQLYPISDVTESIDIRNRSARIFVDDDGALLVDRDAGSFQPKIFGVRRTAERQHDGVHRQRLVVLRPHAEAILRLLDALDDIVAENTDALLFHRLMQALAQVLVETRQDFGAAIDQRRLDTEAVEDIGELDGNVAAAGDQDRLRQFFQMEGFVRGYAKLVPRQRRMQVRPAAGRDNDGLGRDGLAGLQKLDGMGVHQFGAGIEDVRLGVIQPLAVEALQPGDFLILRLDQLIPVETAFADRPAEAGSILEMLAVLRGIDEELLRHTAANDAGPAIAIFLGNADLLAERSGDARAAYAAGAAANDEKVEIKRRHGRLLWT